MFIDVHCHLEMCKSPSDCVKRALEADVGTIVTNSVNMHTNQASLDLAKAFPSVKAALGLYPIEAVSMSDEEIDEIIKFIRKNDDKIVAVGEVGLDYKEDLTQHERQKKVFSRIIDLAIELDKPLIIHTRKAEADVVQMLEEAQVKKAVMHCFSGKMSLVKKIVDNGWHLSIPASIKNATHFQEVVKIVPIEQLLCETDSPYLHPDKLDSNEPANVVESYKKIAEIKGLSLKQVENQIENNYRKLFLGE